MNVFTIILACSLLPLSASVAAQVPDTQRIEALERRVDQLERRLAPEVQQQAIPKGRQAWRSIRQGMTKGDVRGILGEPPKIDTYNSFTSWSYGSGGGVQFDGKSGLVTTINEPR